MISDMERRLRRATEGILGNESLAGDLETEAANSLLAWGLECSMKIVLDTGELEETLAEEICYPRQRALRMLMRLVNRWAKTAPAMDRNAKSALLEEILSQASTIYGSNFVRPDEARRNAILDSEPDKPIQFITALRGLLENRLE